MGRVFTQKVSSAIREPAVPPVLPTPPEVLQDLEAADLDE
jgi:hypothetical protein